MRSLIGLMLLLLLSACTTVVATRSYEPSMMSAPAASEPTRHAVEVREAPLTMSTLKGEPYDPNKQNMLVQEYLYPDQRYRLSPVNFVFFPKKPVTQSEREQYQFICEIWKASFPKKSEVLVNGQVPDYVTIVPIYWPLKKEVKSESCVDLVANYDYGRVQLFAAENKINPTTVQILCKLKSGVVTMNLTRIKKQAELEAAMDVWRKRMCRMPKEDTPVYGYTIAAAAQQVLGMLGRLITFKT